MTLRLGIVLLPPPSSSRRRSRASGTLRLYTGVTADIGRLTPISAVGPFSRRSEDIRDRLLDEGVQQPSLPMRLSVSQISSPLGHTLVRIV